jgi:hypothetical protein
MTWDAKDRAMNSASTLVGYCMSATSLPLGNVPREDFDIFKAWVMGLIEAAKLAASAIDTATDLKEIETALGSR